MPPQLNRHTAQSSVQDDIRQTRAFRSLEQEATIALLRTAAVVEHSLAKVVEAEGLSHAQYNVLRILRGAGPGGLPTLEIRDRMINPAPSITRLLDKLERAGLVRRERSAPNRRQVFCFITDQGLAVLARLDESVDSADDRATAALSEPDLQELIRMLGAVRYAMRSDTPRDAPLSG